MRLVVLGPSKPDKSYSCVTANFFVDRLKLHLIVLRDLTGPRFEISTWGSIRTLLDSVSKSIGHANFCAMTAKIAKGRSMSVLFREVQRRSRVNNRFVRNTDLLLRSKLQLDA